MEYSHQEDHKSVLEEAQKLKEQGNTYFVAKDYDDAERYYTKAIELLLGLQIDQETGNEHEEEKRDESGEPSQHIHTTSEEIDKENKEDEKQEEISRVHPHQRERIATPQPKSSLKDRLPSDLHHPCSVYYANRAACHIAKEAWQAAIEDCSKSLELYPDYPKVLIRRAKAYEESNKLREALQDYTRAHELDPSLRPAAEAMVRLPPRIKEQDEKLKAEMLGQLKELGNKFLGLFNLSVDNFELKQDPVSGGYSINFKQ